MADGPVLDVRQLTAGYGQAPVVEDVSLVVHPGEVVAILGPNGAGKSTLLKGMMGLIERIAGAVVVGGRDISGLRPDQIAARGMSYVPQVDNVFENLTVEENLRMGSYLRPRQTEQRKQEVLRLFADLRAPLRRKAGTLSGGQRNMLAMARGLMLTPHVLLLDEPTAGLAPMIAHQVLEKAREVSQGGTAVLMVEQNVTEALGVSDRAYILVGGGNRYEGTADELRRQDLGAMFLGH